MKKVVIMQPYFFPYLGYFHLLHSCDTFVFLDNVNYINRGWVNRNQFIFSGVPNMFTVPLNGASQNKLINELTIADGKWAKVFLKSLEMSYKKTKNYDLLIEPLKQLIGDGTGKIAELNQRTTLWCADQLGLTKNYKVSSVDFAAIAAVGQDRIIQICQQESAEVYNNAIGGVDLYNKTDFANCGITLEFVRSTLNPYPQTVTGFHPGMSILDVLMNTDSNERQILLKEYTFS
jgi:hypothetical protein